MISSQNSLQLSASVIFTGFHSLFSLNIQSFVYSLGSLIGQGIPDHLMPVRIHSNGLILLFLSSFTLIRHMYASVVTSKLMEVKQALVIDSLDDLLRDPQVYRGGPELAPPNIKWELVEKVQ